MSFISHDWEEATSDTILRKKRKLDWALQGMSPLSDSCREDGHGDTHVGSIVALPDLACSQPEEVCASGRALCTSLNW